MIWKVATFIGIAIAAFFLFRRSGGVTPAALRAAGLRGGSGSAAAPGKRNERGAVEDLTPCPHCGAYRPSSSICDCQRAPTL